MQLDTFQKSAGFAVIQEQKWEKVLSCVRVRVGLGPGCVLRIGLDCPPAAGTLIP